MSTAPAHADTDVSGFLSEPGAGLVHRLAMATQQIAFHLDEEDFVSFLAHFADPAHYRITAFSAELRKEVAFLDLDRTALENLVHGIDDHVRFPHKLVRHLCQPMIAAIDGDRVTCSTKLAVYYVDPQGKGGLYAVGNYHDQFDLSGAPLLLSRNVALETRTLPFGSHIPL